MTEYALSTIEESLEAFRAGRFVIVVDDEDRENEGDLTIAADHITSDAINFMAVHGRGLICLAMQGELLDRLKIPMMVPNNENRSGFGTGFTVSVEAASGVTTGISAADRAHTVKTLIDPASTPNDIAMPGHIFPLRAREGGVLTRRGQTEASVDLALLSDLTPASVICEVMSADGEMARLPELAEFAQEHDICITSVEALARYRQQHETTTSGADADADADVDADNRGTSSFGATRIGASKLPTEHGEFEVVVYRDQQGLEHTALFMGNLAEKTPLVRMHSECLTGDAFGSLRCDCGQQLQTSLAKIAAEGCGILLYLRQEGRGIGLGNKIRAYALQDQGLDTVDANHQLGFPADGREYGIAGMMLNELGVDTVRLLTNNPEKRKALEAIGIKVAERIPLIIPPHEHNMEYLQTKALRMGHTL